MTAGGTGLSLGAVGHDGRTVLTLRGAASAWDEAGLSALLDGVVGRSVRYAVALRPLNHW